MGAGTDVGDLDEIAPADTVLDREVPLTRVGRPRVAVEQRNQCSLGQAGSVSASAGNHLKAAHWKTVRGFLF